MWERDTDLTPGTKARPSKEHIKGTPASLEDYTEDIHNLEERDDFLTRTSGQCHKQHPLIVLHGNYDLAQDTRTLVNHQGFYWLHANRRPEGRWTEAWPGILQRSADMALRMGCSHPLVTWKCKSGLRHPSVSIYQMGKATPNGNERVTGSRCLQGCW